MPITIEDIAKEAGVSKATVSRVMNNTKAVSPELKEKVNQIIEKNNFKPNIFARGLITKRTQTIGVIVSDISNPVNGVLLKGINKICQIHDYTVMVCESQGETTKEFELVKTLEDKNVEGIIIISRSNNTTLPHRIKDIEYPIIFISGVVDHVSDFIKVVYHDAYKSSIDTNGVIPYVEEGIMAAKLLFDNMKEETRTKTSYIEHKILKGDNLTHSENSSSGKEMEVYLL